MGKILAVELGHHNIFCDVGRHIVGDNRPAPHLPLHIFYCFQYFVISSVGILKQILDLLPSLARQKLHCPDECLVCCMVYFL